jgi:hypothetical protein
MSFSRGQQADYRPLVAEAWRAHAVREGLPLKDKVAYDTWYRAELRKATGRETTADCNKGRHWEKACAHFEGLADAGIQFQLKLIQGDLKRIRYAAGKANPGYLRQFRTDADLDRYARSIALQAGLGDVELYQLDDDGIQTVTRAICIAAHRARREALQA